MSLYMDTKANWLESVLASDSEEVGSILKCQSRYSMINIPSQSKLRVELGIYSPISENGNLTKEGIIYVPGGKNHFVPYSPLLLNPMEAMAEHLQGREFYPTQSEIDEALSFAVELPDETFEIPTKDFGKDFLTVLLCAGEVRAQNYGDLLTDALIKTMSFKMLNKDEVNRHKRPFVRQIYLGHIGYGGKSDIEGRRFYEDNKIVPIRGIRNFRIDYDNPSKN